MIGVDTPLHRLRDRMSLAQIAVATATVGVAGGIAPWSLALAAVLCAWAFVRPLPPVTTKATERAWTLLVGVALVATLTRAVLTAELLDSGLDFLLLLVVQRLFNRQRAREHMQLLLLGSLLVVAGAVINAGLNYPLLFALYLVVAAMTLLLNHLVAEGERLGARTAVTLSREGMRAAGSCGAPRVRSRPSRRSAPSSRSSRSRGGASARSSAAACPATARAGSRAPSSAATSAASSPTPPW